MPLWMLRFSRDEGEKGLPMTLTRPLTRCVRGFGTLSRRRSPGPATRMSRQADLHVVAVGRPKLARGSNDVQVWSAEPARSRGWAAQTGPRVQRRAGLGSPTCTQSRLGSLNYPASSTTCRFPSPDPHVVAIGQSKPLLRANYVQVCHPRPACSQDLGPSGLTPRVHPVGRDPPKHEKRSRPRLAMDS